MFFNLRSTFYNKFQIFLKANDHFDRAYNITDERQSNNHFIS